jgi:hypothetical protein
LQARPPSYASAPESQGRLSASNSAHKNIGDQYIPDEHGRWRSRDDVGDGEYQHNARISQALELKINDRISQALELKINTHTSNHGDSEIDAIHQADRKHETECDNKSKVNPTNDLFLLLWGECIDELLSKAFWFVLCHRRLFEMEMFSVHGC